ncbi:peroxiredoxin [Crenothrix sp.]|uniref:peroxiredoxin n=1 Tax=Crenothrix sp. TaxID=3100433 RepID=UPI00374D5106
MLEVQQNAPMFRSKNQNNQLVSLTDYAGEKNIVLYFYPKDDTPGCTIEANDFTALADEFSALDTVVIGVSKDSCSSHVDFINKYGLKVQLLADTSGDLCESYGVWREREKNGVKSMAIMRSTFVIDKNGVLVYVNNAVNHEGHAQEVLDFIKSLSNPEQEAPADSAE